MVGFFVSVSVAGGVSGIVVGLLSSTSISAVLIGLIAGLFSIVGGSIVYLFMSLVEDQQGPNNY